MKINKNQRKSMKIPRSEAVDKSLGVFFDAEFDFNCAGTPERLNKLKNRFFEKNENFKKMQKIIKSELVRKIDETALESRSRAEIQTPVVLSHSRSI